MSNSQSAVPETSQEVMTVEETRELVLQLIAAEGYVEMISTLEDEIITLGTTVHELKEEVAQIWKELE